MDLAQAGSPRQAPDAVTSQDAGDARFGDGDGVVAGEIPDDADGAEVILAA